MSDSNFSSLLTQLEQQFPEVVIQDLVPDAFVLVREFDPLIRAATNSERSEDHRLVDLYWRAKFMAIPMLDEDEILELLHTHLSVMFTVGADYNLIDKLRARCVSIPAYDHRDIFKARIRLALLQSNVVFTTTPLLRNGQEVPGTVGAWLSDAQSVLGAGVVPVAKLEEYLATSGNPRRLTDGDRKRLRTVLTFIEYTKRSSQTIDGIEERPTIVDRDGTHRVMDKTGHFIAVENPELLVIAKLALKSYGQPIPSLLTSMDETETVVSDTAIKTRPGSTSPPRPRPLVAAVVAAAEDELENMAHGTSSVSKMRGLSDTLGITLKIHDRERAIAVLRLLARANAIGKFLIEARTTMTRQEFVEHLKRKYGEAYVLAFEAHPDRIQFQTAFLDWLFREKLNLEEQDAAREREVIVTLLN